MARHGPREARTLGLWTAAWLGGLLLGGLLWLGDISLQWPVLVVPVLWALVAARPRRRRRGPPRGWGGPPPRRTAPGGGAGRSCRRGAPTRSSARPSTTPPTGGTAACESPPRVGFLGRLVPL